MIAYFAAIFAGFNVALQIALNDRLAQHIPREWVIFVSHLGGALIVGLFLLLFQSELWPQARLISGFRSAPWYSLAGGACGVIIVGCILYSLRRLPIASVLCMVVAGEMFTSLIIGIFLNNASIKSNFSISTILGSIFICLGTFLIKS